MTSLRSRSHVDGAIDSSWFSADLHLTSPTWRLMYVEDAAASGDLTCDALSEHGAMDAARALANGWPQDATALAWSAWWVVEALWRNGLAASVLGAAHLRRARQIGLAVLAIVPVDPPADPAAAVWLASEMFDVADRTTIRLQLARPHAFDDERSAALIRQIAPPQARRLVSYARTAMGLS